MISSKRAARCQKSMREAIKFSEQFDIMPKKGERFLQIVWRSGVIPGIRSQKICETRQAATEKHGAFSSRRHTMSRWLSVPLWFGRSRRRR
jgi:hypothetical protein